MSEPTLPKLFATVAEAEVILGVSRTAIYAKLIRRHPELLIQFNGRSLTTSNRLRRSFATAARPSQGRSRRVVIARGGPRVLRPSRRAGYDRR